MAKLTELQIKNDIIADSPDTFEGLPEQFGGFAPPPQPGSYRVQFPPAGALSEAWDTFETEKGQRIASVLRDTAALKIVQSPAGRYDNEMLSTRISNAERKRDKAGNQACDMDYALAAAKYPGKKPKFGDNTGYAQAFMHLAGKQIGIDWELQWFCNEKRPIRVHDDANGTVVLDGKDGRDEQLGCGARYYMKDVDKQPSGDGGQMEYPQEIECSGEGCGALLRAVGQIARFRE